MPRTPAGFSDGNRSTPMFADSRPRPCRSWTASDAVGALASGRRLVLASHHRDDNEDQTKGGEPDAHPRLVVGRPGKDDELPVEVVEDEGAQTEDEQQY